MSQKAIPVFSFLESFPKKLVLWVGIRNKTSANMSGFRTFFKWSRNLNNQAPETNLEKQKYLIVNNLFSGKLCKIGSRIFSPLAYVLGHKRETR